MLKKSTLLLFFILVSSILQAQVSEIGLYFEGKGYIQEIQASTGEIFVNFKEKRGLVGTTVLLKDPASKSLVSGISDIRQLRLGMEIEILGDKYVKEEYVVAKKIKLVDMPRRSTIKEGVIVDIISDFAIIDGERVKLKRNGKISGDKKKLYKGKTFKNLKELKLGDFASVSGEYDPQGFILASEILVSPNLESVKEKALKAMDRGAEMNEIFNNWNDLKKRPGYFGTKFKEYGTIVSSPSLQAYAHKLGMSMVPDFMKEQLDFRFIVFENPSWNANAEPDGLVKIYTGFLNDVENEAQFAAVIGHEIAHVICEHGLGRVVEAEKATSKEEKVKKMQNTTVNSLKVFSNWVDIPLVKNNYTTKRKFKSNLDSISNSLDKYITSSVLRGFSEYNVVQESQADRIGLYLMVKAGYDPREAMKVWKKSYNSSNNVSEDDVKAIKGNSAGSTFANEFDKYRKPPTTADLGVYFLKNSLKNKTQDNIEKSFHNDGQLVRHPDDVVRFTSLNELTNLYYNNLSGATRLGTAELLNIRIVAADESIAAYMKAFEGLARKNAAAINKEKKYQAARDKIALAQSKKSNYLASFHGFNMFPVYTFSQLVGAKSKCNVGNLEANLSEVFNDIQSKQQKFVNEFKSGRISPNEKCIRYASRYLLDKNFNDLMIDIAARYKICDTEYLNSINQEIEKGTFYNYIQPNANKLEMTFNYLVGKEEELVEKK